ncbi:MAG: germination protein YpeB [Firmicutes bacterium]|nr:germination protein YpeB [Bacillota bacterium]
MMNRRSNGWVIPALGIGLLGFALYGYNEHQQRATLVASAMNGLKGDYHGLTYEVEEMQTDVAKALAVSLPTAQTRYLQDASRSATAARVYAAKLPINDWPDGAALSFLDRVIQSTTADAQEIARTKRWTAKDRAEMVTLQQGSTALAGKLRAGQGTLLATGAIKAAPTTTSKTHSGNASSMATALSNADQATRVYVAQNKGPLTGRQSSEQGQDASRLDQGRAIAPGQAAILVEGFLRGQQGQLAQLKPKVSRLSASYGYPGYLVTLGMSGKAPLVYATVSAHGGHVMWLTQEPGPTSGHVWDVPQARQAAVTFLRQHGFGGLTLMTSSSYANSTTLTYAPMRQGVAMYDQPIHVKWNLASGQMTSYDATSYWTKDWPSFSLTPKVSERTAVAALAPDMAVQGARLAVIENPSGQQVLVYDILSHRQGDTYRIYVSATTGQVVTIDKLTKVGDLS